MLINLASASAEERPALRDKVLEYAVVDSLQHFENLADIYEEDHGTRQPDPLFRHRELIFRGEAFNIPRSYNGKRLANTLVKILSRKEGWDNITIESYTRGSCFFPWATVSQLAENVPHYKIKSLRLHQSEVFEAIIEYCDIEFLESLTAPNQVLVKLPVTIQYLQRLHRLHVVSCLPASVFEFVKVFDLFSIEGNQITDLAIEYDPAYSPENIIDETAYRSTGQMNLEISKPHVTSALERISLIFPMALTEPWRDSHRQDSSPDIDQDCQALANEIFKSFPSVKESIVKHGSEPDMKEYHGR